MIKTMDYSKFDKLQPTYPVLRKGREDFKPVLRVPDNFLKTVREIRHYEDQLKDIVLSISEHLEFVIDAFSTNVHYSTKIEGNPLSLDEVKRITRNTFRRNRESKPDMPTQEIIQHITSFFNRSFLDFPWTTDKISEAHRELFSYDSENYPGFLRDSAEDSYGVGNEETGELYFRPTCGTHVKREMDSFVEWINSYAIGYEPLAAAPVMFHEFESIHPFYDGNGRMGRVLLHCYLQRCGFQNSYLCKIDKHLLRNSELYYRLLAWTDQNQDYTPLIDYMSTAILESYREAYEVLSSKDLLSTGIDETSRKLLFKAREKTIEDFGKLSLKDSGMNYGSDTWLNPSPVGWFSVSDAVRWLDGPSSATVRKYLNNLVEIEA
ncbi:MAG: Fic family protein, partial [Candidatus Thermoplasmatota archaeon]|nr:Fic family protein [Candidatus Thermoplasmatota archaeon]